MNVRRERGEMIEKKERVMRAISVLRLRKEGADQAGRGLRSEGIFPFLTQLGFNFSLAKFF